MAVVFIGVPLTKVILYGNRGRTSKYEYSTFNSYFKLRAQVHTYLLALLKIEARLTKLNKGGIKDVLPKMWNPK